MDLRRVKDLDPSPLYIFASVRLKDHRPADRIMSEGLADPPHIALTIDRSIASESDVCGVLEMPHVLNVDSELILAIVFIGVLLASKLLW